MKRTPQIVLVGAALACFVAPAASAQQLINNGGFESGFSGWTRVDQTGSEGTWLQQSGTTTPVNMITVPAPPGGSNAAMTDASGPGSHVLYQDFTVPMSLGVATLSFDLFIRNHANAFFSPTTLDFATPALNQQFRVDIMTTSADPFSVTMGDVLFTVYQTQPGNPLVSGYLTITADLTALFAARPGETLRLRFAEVDNVNFFNVGVDNVSLVVPEPGTIGLVLLGAGLLAARVVRRIR